MPWCTRITDAEAMKRDLKTIMAIVAMTTIAFASFACSQFEQRDKRFYYRALWNFALREQFKELDTEFNGVDFGHSNLYENLLLTVAKDVEAIETTARKETLRFIATRPPLNPNEETIAPTYMKLAWKAQNTFDEAHALHRATYDIYVSDLKGKRHALEKVLAFYRDSDHAITSKRLDHRRLDTLPYSKSFRRKFPLFNATIWAYHYLQVVVYDALGAAETLSAKQRAVEPILKTYHGYLNTPPVEWTFMPMTGELSPKFTEDYPEIANIFDNLHMMHDTISDILSSDLFPTWEDKRKEIYRVTQNYYWATADATNPFIVRDGHLHHSGSPPTEKKRTCKTLTMGTGAQNLFWIAVIAVVMRPTAIHALDHDNLDPNRPIAIEDAYVIPKGEIGVEGGVTFNDRKEGKGRFGFQPQIIYGAFYNMQLEIMTGLVTEPSTVSGDDKSGDLSVGVLYNFNTETIDLPAFAVRAEFGFPTGVNSKGVDTELTGVMTRSFGRWRTHVNVGYTFLGSPQGQERGGTYRIVAAVTYPLGYPTSFRDTIIANIFTRQSDLMGQRNPTGVGIGLRHQMSSRVVFEAGVGTEFIGPIDRSLFLSTIGLSIGF